MNPELCPNNQINSAWGAGSCVLLRAVEPLEGDTAMSTRRMASRRPRNSDANRRSKDFKRHQLCNGPSKLCTAFAIEKASAIFANEFEQIAIHLMHFFSVWSGIIRAELMKMFVDCSYLFARHWNYIINCYNYYINVCFLFCSCCAHVVLNSDSSG